MIAFTSLGVEGVVDVFSHLDGLGPGLGQQAQTTEDVAHRAFREEHDRPVDHDVGVGSVDHEQVGEAHGGHAEVGARIAVPLVAQLSTNLIESALRGMGPASKL